MATDHKALGPTFSSPSMAARAACIRTLALIDSLELAERAGDPVAIGRHLAAIHHQLHQVDDIAYRAFLDNASIPVPVVREITESEARLLDGNR